MPVEIRMREGEGERRERREIEDRGESRERMKGGGEQRWDRMKDGGKEGGREGGREEGRKLAVTQEKCFETNFVIQKAI